MQKLTFQSAWDKTIADRDRERIKETFQKAELAPGVDIQFTSLWQAKNHRGDLLVAMLIHNTSYQDYTFHNQEFSYVVNDTILAKYSFSPGVTIQKQTSMPWTFIFPTGSFNSNAKFEGGQLRGGTRGQVP
ncbi:SLAP domain-containing protein [Virgibacillus phasianinus]|uniref:SLAP domain-containing protein n=1 Tax=Virgibacillus phasianinus TaxID=2017483 RepID=A0A220U7F5_9BACI|nr:SLAP domain-containing protein [Virgibacillus phasianinus]ASK64040.1 SLAP domain-containing protein [Virgibacillus phasianinus]